MYGCIQISLVFKRLNLYRMNFVNVIVLMLKSIDIIHVCDAVSSHEKYEVTM